MYDNKTNIPEDIEIQDDTLPNENVRWSSRRKMAWVSLWSMILVVLIIILPLITPEKINAIEGIIISFIITCGGLVGSYTGFKAFAKLHNN